MTDWYEYPTNYSNGSSVNGVWDFFFEFPQYIIGDYYASGIILLIWTAIFAINLVIGSRKSTMVASFITFFFSIHYFMQGQLSALVPVILIVLTIVGAIGSKEGDGL